MTHTPAPELSYSRHLIIDEMVDELEAFRTSNPYPQHEGSMQYRCAPSLWGYARAVHGRMDDAATERARLNAIIDTDGDPRRSTRHFLLRQEAWALLDLWLRAFGFAQSADTLSQARNRSLDETRSTFERIHARHAGNPSLIVKLANAARESAGDSWQSPAVRDAAIDQFAALILASVFHHADRILNAADLDAANMGGLFDTTRAALDARATVGATVSMNDATGTASVTGIEFQALLFTDPRLRPYLEAGASAHARMVPLFDDLITAPRSMHDLLYPKK